MGVGLVLLLSFVAMVLFGGTVSRQAGPGGGGNVYGMYKWLWISPGKPEVSVDISNPRPDGEKWFDHRLHAVHFARCVMDQTTRVCGERSFARAPFWFTA